MRQCSNASAASTIVSNLMEAIHKATLCGDTALLASTASSYWPTVVPLALVAVAVIAHP
jgi:hypothetical protein